MVAKLKRDALLADLASVNSLLRGRNEKVDPVGFAQFEQRRERLAAELEQLSETSDLLASVGLFFSGGPVVGSRGIRSDFAGKALGNFQAIVSKTFAARHGEIGVRGPVAFRSASSMLLTDVVRGSVGFVLEESPNTMPLTSTPLHQVVEEVASFIAHLASDDSQVAELALDGIDWRQLLSLREFFSLLDESRASLRIVESWNEFILDADAVHRARVLTDGVRTVREVRHFSGRLRIFTDARTFELIPTEGSAIHGDIDPEFSADTLRQFVENPENPLSRNWDVRLSVETRERPGVKPRVTYELLGLIGETG